MARVPILGDVSGVLDEGLEGLEHNFITARIEDLAKFEGGAAADRAGRRSHRDGAPGGEGLLYGQPFGQSGATGNQKKREKRHELIIGQGGY